MPSYKDAVRGATTTNIPLPNGVSSVDGIIPALQAGNRVLVKDQLLPQENGIYVVGSPWKRSLDFPPGLLVDKEVAIRVSEGATYAHTEWYLATQGTVSVDMDPLVFAQSVGFKANERIYYVSKSSNASDTNDGRSPTSAFTTIDRALVALGVTEGIIQLGVGLFDAPTYGIALFARQSILGAGGLTTRIFGKFVDAPSVAVVSLTGSRSACRDLWITHVPAGKTGLRVTTVYPHWTPSTPYAAGRLVSNAGNIYTCITAGVSAASGGPTGNGNSVVDNSVIWSFVEFAKTTAQRIRCDNIFIDNLVADPAKPATIAFGIGDDTSKDVSETCLVACSSNGNGTSIHMLLGNGTTANVLNTSNFGGSASAHQFAVKVNGGTLTSRGLCFGQSTDADIYLRSTPTGTTSIVGGRSENSQRFLRSEYGAFGFAFRVADYTVVALRNTDGQGVRLGNASITLDNITLNGRDCPQYVWVDRNPKELDWLPVVSARNFGTDHPHPFQSPWAHPGVIIRSEATRFIGDVDLLLWNRRRVEHWTRRTVIASDNQPIALNPANFEAVDIRLGNNAGSFTLAPGVIGQRVSICFEQDGVGGKKYSWPANCAFSGGAPVAVLTRWNRQTCEFRWTGRFWEQYGPVTSVMPPILPASPIADTFSLGNPYWLNMPSPPVTGGPAWEHVPGGGSLGITGGQCKCQVLGWFGDKDNDVNNGLTGLSAAGAVIETGMMTPTISTTFTWHATEGIITNYLDDMTFVLFFLTATHLKVRPFSNGKPLGSFVFTQPLGTTLVAGSTHTLRVRITNTGYEVSLDGGAITIGNEVIKLLTPTAADFQLVKDLTKHGIIAGSTSVKFMSPGANAPAFLVS